MIERDIQEWEEYDSRLLDGSPFSQGTPATQRSKDRLLETSDEGPVGFEGPFLLGSAGETETQTEGERGGRRPAQRAPQFRTGRPGPPTGGDCDCGDSATDPSTVETGEYRESEGLEKLETEAFNGAFEEHSVSQGQARGGSRADPSASAEASLEMPYEVDPYADIRPALRPEHASLAADELSVIVGRQPTLVALHRMLASPEPQLAALAVLLGKAGRRSMRLNGSDVPIPSYLRLLSRLCHEAAEQTEAEAAPTIVAGASGTTHDLNTSELEGSYELLVDGQVDGTRRKWAGATQDQLNFMRAVYVQHVANAQSRRTFIADVAASDLALVEAGQRLRAEAASKCVSMLADARGALAAAQHAGDSSALPISSIVVVSGYRSASQQFNIWQSNLPKYYAKTATHRSSLSGGAHGPDAVSYLAKYVGQRVAAPGFGSHNDGLAVDFGANLTGDRRLTPDSSDASIKLWRSSWLFQWLSSNAANFNFFQNNAINEPWHWEYRGTSAISPTQEVSGAAVFAGNTYISNTSLLSAHHGTQPDLYVCWNGMPAGPSSVDVVVHLHGHSSDRGRMLLRNKVADSGLDFSDPSGSGSGRTRASVGIIPRGDYAPRSATPQRGPNSDVYAFSALVGPTAMRNLIAYGLGRFATSIGASNTISQSRLILTCHSGGGDWLGAILRNVDPDEIHLFDAIYSTPQALLAWIDRHVAADDARTTGDSAFRMFYTDGKSTTPHAIEIAARVRSALRKANNTWALAPYFKIELTTVDHPKIPRTYGWQLLVNASAGVTQTTQISPP